MNAIRMEREALLKIVRENKTKHIAAFEEAIVDFKQLVLQIASANIKLAETGNLENFKKIKSLPSAPTSYEDSYHRAIRMLELSIDEVIEIEEDIFNQLVLDEWNWKRGFTASTMLYKSGMVD